MIQAVFFDFNGVIIDDEPLHLKAYTEALADVSVELTEEDYFKSLGMDDVTFVRAAFNRTGRELSDDALRRVIESESAKHRALIEDELPLAPGVVTFVKALSRRHPLGVVSMAARHSIDYGLSRAGLAAHFTVVVSAEGIPTALRRPETAAAAFTYPESAGRALALAVERAEWLRREAGSFLALDGVDVRAAREAVDAALVGSDERWLKPEEIRTLLGAYGIPLVPEETVAAVDDAVAAARRLGFPVVVKTAAAGAHKTETGGVAVELASEDDVRAAATRIGPPLLVQPMIAGGIELLVGVVQDPVFGPLVAVGPGGVLAELIGDARFAVAPLTDVDARELVRAGKAGRLISGFRGRPPADAGALVELVQRLSHLAEDLPEVSELDLNPVIALSEGCVAVDARVRLRRTTPRDRLKTW